MHLFVPIFLLLALVLPSPVGAAPSGDLPTTLAEAHERIRQLEAENRLLRAELQRQLVAQTTAPQAETAAAQSPTEAADTAPSSAGPKQVYRGLRDLIRDLPPNLIPSLDSGWDRYQQADVLQWMHTHPEGKAFSERLILTRASVSRARGEAANSPTPWHVSLSFRPREVTFRGMTLTEEIHVTFIASEPLARRAESLTSGTSMGVSGTLKAATFVNGLNIRSRQHRLRLQFSDIELTHPQFRHHGPCEPY